MKITSVRATPFSLPMGHAVTSAGIVGALSTMQDVLIRVESDTGLTGTAEAWGLPAAWGEGQRATVDVVNNLLAPLVEGLDPLDTERILAAINPPGGVSFGFSAKAGVDMAIHDLIGKALGIPVYKYLGGWNDPPMTQLTWMCALGEPEVVAAEAREFADKFGFTAFKLKVGEDPDRDVAAVAAVRREMGDDALIYVDANMAYTPEVAIRTILRMQEHNLAWVEDPCPGTATLHARRKIVNAVNVPVMGDMVCRDAPSALRELQQGTSTMIAVKIFRTGFMVSKRIVKLAEEFGVPCVIGVSGESMIGTLAGAHFASALRNVHQPAELSFPFKLTDEIVTAGTPRLDSAEIALDPAVPGIGAEVDEQKLAQYRDRYEADV